MNGLWLDYESDGFPANVVPQGRNQLSVNWADILWAAVTVGRPDIFHVFRYGQASVHELGLVVCKLFASKLLDSPWTLHLDVFRAVLRPRLLGGRSRPDMVAQSTSWQQWHAFECKGRASMPSSTDKQKAKAQAQRLVTVGGSKCTLHVGAITFFRNDTVSDCSFLCWIHLLERIGPNKLLPSRAPLLSIGNLIFCKIWLLEIECNLINCDVASSSLSSAVRQPGRSRRARSRRCR